MGFLNKNVKSGDAVSVISEECQFQGALDLRGSLRVEGKLEGNINNAKFVTITVTGVVTGDICAKGVVLMGKLEGDICADGVELLSTASMSGNIRSKSILIENGAKLNASINASGAAQEDSCEGEEILAGGAEKQRGKKGEK
jgi:cytoskeletal protein CcmA (bactofilin family)